MIEVDLTFTPIHDFTPQSDSDFINNTPVPKPPKTETPSDTPDTINEPIPSSAPITGNISLQPGAIEVGE
jgi:hypothetical protein